MSSAFLFGFMVCLLAVRTAFERDGRRPRALPLPGPDPHPTSQEEYVMERTTLLGRIEGFLAKHQLPYRLVDDPAYVEARVRGATARFALEVRVDDDPLAIYAIVRIPFVTPPDLRPAMAETIARINSGLALGRYLLDFGQGDLTFRAALVVADGTVTDEQIHNLLYRSLATVDRYHRALARLIFADDLSPAEVVAEVEMAN